MKPLAKFLLLLLLLLPISARAYVETGSNTVLLMHFNEGDGQNVYDESANGLNGIRGISTANATNDPTWVTPPSGCRFGNCFDFNADWVRVTDAAALDITGDLTVEAWIHPDNGDEQGQAIVSKWSGTASTSSYILRFDSSSNDDIEFCVSDATTIRCVDTQGSTNCNNALATDAILYHVAGSYNATSDTIQVWVNGLRCENTAPAGGASINSTATDLLIGSLFTNSPPTTISTTTGAGGGAFNGRIDEVRIRSTIPDDSIATGTTGRIFNPGPVISGVTHTPAAGDDSFTIYNGGGVTIDLNGWVFEQCSTGNDYNVSGAHTIAAGATITVVLDTTAPAADTATVWNTGNDPGASDMATLSGTDCLRVYGQSTTAANTIIDYVAWGADAGAGDDEAVTAGLWRGGTFVSTVPTLNQATIQLFTPALAAETKIGDNEEGVLDWARHPHITIQGEEAPRASGDWYSADNGGGINTFYRYFVEVPSGSGALRVEIWDADVLNNGGAAEDAAGRDRSRGGSTNTVYRLVDPGGGTVATYTGDAATGTDNTFMTPNGFLVAAPTTGTYTVQIDATAQATDTDDDINQFTLRAEGFQIKSNFIQFGANADLTKNYLVYPWIKSGCNFTIYDFDSDQDPGTTTQQINFRDIVGATTFNWTVPDASLSDNDVWVPNNNTTTVPTGFINDSNQSSYGSYGLIGTIATPAGEGNYTVLEIRNFEGCLEGDCPGDAHEGDANLFQQYLPVDNGGPPVVPFIVQRVQYISGTNPPAAGSTTRMGIIVEVINPTGTDLTSPTVTSFLPASVGGNVTYTAVGPTGTTVTQGTVTTEPAATVTTGGAVSWSPGTIAAATAFVRMRYQFDVTPISAGRKILTGTPTTSGTQATYTSAHSSAETVGPICELALTTGTSITATEVELAELSATPYNDAVLVEWRTGSELNNLGFNVYRSQSLNGDYVQINDTIILGLLTSPAGGNYYFVDQDVQPGQTYYYLVEDIDLSGATEKHGPVSALVDSGLTSFAASSFNPAFYTGGGWFNGETGSGGSSGTPPVPVPPVSIEQSGDDIIITLYPEAPVLTPVVHDGETYEQVAVTGYVASGAPCHPQLPERTLLVGLPEREAVFSIEAFETASLALPAGERVYPQSQYQLNSGGTALEPVFCENAAAYLQSTPVSLNHMIDWLGTSWSGGHHFASIRVHPVLYTPNDGTLTYATRIVVRLHLGDAVTAPVQPTAPPADNLVEHFVVISTPGAVKMQLNNAGLYQLDRPALLAAGFAINSDPRNWKIFYRGREQAALLLGNGDGIFDADERLLFYAQANDDFQAELQNAYWLIPAPVPGLRMAVIDGTPAGGAIAESRFWSDKTSEENHFYFSSIPNGEGVDHWFWQYAVAPASPSFPIAINGLDASAGSDALLEVRLRGVTSYAGSDPDHHALILVNGHAAGDFTFDGQTELDAAVSVPLAWLNEGANSVQVQLPGDLPVPFDAIYIDKFTLTYPRLFAAVGDVLEFNTDLYGDHEAGGFSTDDIVVVDLTEDLEAPAVLNNIDVAASGGGYQARFLPPDYAFGGEFVAAAAASLPRPDQFATVASADLHSAQNRGDYLIISAPEFVGAVQTLADYRQSRGYQVKVASTDDVYNEFGYGVASPQAVRDFLRYAQANWATPPKYVLLVGDGTYDPKGYLGPVSGNHNFVPVPFVETSFMQAGSDTWYGLVDDADLIPDLYVGRLPVSDVTTLHRFIGRIISYETTPDSGTWERKITLVQDNVEAGHEETDNHFAQTIAAIAEKIPSNYTQQMISQDALGGVAQARQAILDDINAGTLMLTYVGHGSIQLWTSEVLFQNTSVASLSNEHLPLVVAMNCLNNYFFFPGFTSLAETMLNAETGGAIAFWSSTGLSTPDWQQILSVGFYDALFGNTHALAATSSSPITLGRAVSAATLSLQGHPEASDVLETFAVLGDPALELKIPQQVIEPQNPQPGNPGGGGGVSADTNSSSAAGCSFGGEADLGDAALLLALFLPLATLALLKRRAKKSH